MTQIATLIIDMAANVSRLMSDMQSARTAVTGAAGDMQRAANTARSALEAIGVTVSVAAVIASVKQIGSALIDAEASAVKFRAAMGSIAGADNVARELDFVRSTARQLGLDLDATANSYIKLAASARGTSLAGAQTQEIFTAVSRAATTLGLSSAEADGALLAISQMMSKGTVQAEELRGQLGERLPGAFQVAARAMGVSTQELGKMLEAGQVMADDFLPKFAKELMKMGESAEAGARTAARELQRMKNAWSEFTQAVADSGAAQAIGGVLGRFASAFSNIAEQIRIAKAEGKGFLAQMGAAIDAPFGGTAQQRLNTATRDYNNASGLFANLDRMDAQSRINRAGGELSILNADKGYADETSRGRFGEIAAASAKAAGEVSKLTGELTKLRSEMSGQDKDFQAHLSTYRRAFELGIIPTQKEYVELVTKLIEKEGGVKDAMKARKEAEKEAEKQAKKLNETMFESLGVNKDYLEELQRLHGLYRKKKLDVDEYRKAVERLIQAQPGVKENAKAEADAHKYLADMQRAASEAREKYAESMARGLEEAEKTLAKLIEEREKIGLTKDAVGELTAKRYESMAAAAEQKAEEASLNGEYADLIVTLEKTAVAYRNAAAVARETGFAEAAAEDAKKASAEAKKVADAWKTQTDNIERSITDSLMRGFESGKGFAQGLVDTLKSMFKTLVLQPVIKAIVQPLAGNLSTMLGLGGLGLAPVAGAAPTAVGVGNSGGMLGTIANGLGTAASTIGGWLGLGGASAAAGVQGATALAIGAEASAVAGIGGGAGLMSTIGAAMPWLGAALAIYSLVAKKRGGPKLGGSFTTGGLDRFYTPTTADSDLSGIGSGVLTSIAQYANTLGGSASGIGLSLGFDSDPQGSAGSRISALLRSATGADIYSSVNRDVGRDDSVLQSELGNETAKLIIAGLKDAQLPTAVRDFIASIDLARVTAGTLDSIIADAAKLAPQVSGDPGMVLYSNAQRADLMAMGPRPSAGGITLYDANWSAPDGAGPGLPLSPIEQAATVLGDAPRLAETIAEAVATATGGSDTAQITSSSLDVLREIRDDARQAFIRMSESYDAMVGELKLTRTAFERINVIATMSAARAA